MKVWVVCKVDRAEQQFTWKLVQWLLRHATDYNFIELYDIKIETENNEPIIIGCQRALDYWLKVLDLYV